MADTSIRMILHQEFENFDPPTDFSGGCRKSEKLSGFCVHLRHDGTIGKWQSQCPHYPLCKGQNFKFQLNP